jgi:ssDNA-binding Zn-finger/Zn-ribbon topoisomerase 1
MVRRPVLPSAHHLLERTEASEAAFCPKCHGVGEITLMRRQLAPDTVDTCPACQGYGVIYKSDYQNPARDPLQQAVGVSKRR